MPVEPPERQTPTIDRSPVAAGPTRSFGIGAPPFIVSISRWLVRKKVNSIVSPRPGDSVWTVKRSPEIS
jgi:hypothetical protein